MIRIGPTQGTGAFVCTIVDAVFAGAAQIVSPDFLEIPFIHTELHFSVCLSVSPVECHDDIKHGKNDCQKEDVGCNCIHGSPPHNHTKLHYTTRQYMRHIYAGKEHLMAENDSFHESIIDCVTGNQLILKNEGIRERLAGRLLEFLEPCPANSLFDA